MRYSVFVLMVLFGCAVPPASLSPTGSRAYQANQAVVALNVVQTAAIGLNQIQRCDPTCHPLLSEANTRMVGNTLTAARTAMDAAPNSWRAVSRQALTQIAAQLDAGGNALLSAYLTAANAVITSLVP